MVNQTVPKGLRELGYTENEVDEIIAFIDQNDTVEGAPHLKEKDLAVFDCAFRPETGRGALRGKDI